MIMWCLKSKVIRRRPVALVGAAATSMLVGVALFRSWTTSK